MYSLDWEILPQEVEEEYLYSVQVKRHPSPKKQTTASLKTTARATEETNIRPPCTPPRKGVIEVTSSENNVASTDDRKEKSSGNSTGSSSDTNRFAKGRLVVHLVLVSVKKALETQKTQF